MVMGISRLFGHSSPKTKGNSLSTNSTQADLDAAVSKLNTLIAQLEAKQTTPPPANDIDLTGLNATLAALDTVLNPPPPVTAVTVADANTPPAEVTQASADETSAIPAHLQAQQA